MPRQEPRLSINKLGEYLTCGAARRRRILEDAKHPKDFIAPRYNDFYAVAPLYLQSNPLDESIIAAAINEIQGRQPGSEWEEQNKTLNVDLLTNLIDIPDRLSLNGFTVTAMPNTQNDLDIAGVAVSVRPEILLTGTVRGRNIVGALKLYLPKTFPLDETTADYITTTVHQHLTTNPPQDGEIDYRYCFVADIPSRAVYSAPRSFTRRRSDIEAACDEIATRWASI